MGFTNLIADGFSMADANDWDVAIATLYPSGTTYTREVNLRPMP